MPHKAGADCSLAWSCEIVPWGLDRCIKLLQAFMAFCGDSGTSWGACCACLAPASRHGQQQEGCWLQGHNRPVMGLAWSEDDTQLISVGGSACYFWQLPAGRRIAAMDHVDLSQVRPDMCVYIYTHTHT